MWVSSFLSWSSPASPFGRASLTSLTSTARTAPSWLPSVLCALVALARPGSCSRCLHQEVLSPRILRSLALRSPFALASARPIARSLPCTPLLQVAPRSLPRSRPARPSLQDPQCTVCHPLCAQQVRLALSASTVAMHVRSYINICIIPFPLDHPAFSSFLSLVSAFLRPLPTLLTGTVH